MFGVLTFTLCPIRKMTEFDQLFKALNIREENLKEEILKVGIVQTVPKNFSIVEQHKYIKWLALVISGKVRVWQENDDRQILLYYVNPNNSSEIKKPECKVLYLSS